MPLPREIDFMPGGDFAFMVLIPPRLTGLCELWFYDWDQVEENKDDGKSGHVPAFHAAIAEREMLLLAKQLLKLVGHEAYKQISSTHQGWKRTGNETAEGER